MAAYQPRIEELSDSDPSDMDPSEFLPASKDVLTPVPSIMKASQIPSQGRFQAAPPPPKTQTKTWSTLYPVYFDSSRTRAEGRRVSKSLAVANPLATEVADAVRSLGLNSTLEVMSTHPKDWANVGRIKVQMKDAESGRRMVGSANVQNKHHLYILVAKYLQSHPTTEQTPLRLPSVPGEKVEPKPAPNIPRGWKINAILPMHSPAVKGSGVTDNPLKEAMAQLGQGGDAMGLEAGPSDSGESKKKKKDKKKG
ncbi:MAG: hypothetical protein GOMPHAMPRED_008155 [Gomphillus americanus]|uniref:Signal recognition particle, SRP19 subunit n=1 Tax=Gomphillus americanus TaxID=1940652 RepID=A0A8H3EZS7_9LECA|nr:MAG: hypothetical protein GOMPHAMPRED_008155 [Gomphillus americanus]